MNAMDSSLPSPWRMRITLAALLCMLTSPTMAASPSRAPAPAKENLKPRPELVLTLPDQWLATDNNPLPPSSNSDSFSINPAGRKQRAVKVDCAMDANPLTTYDNSLSNRWQGECNLGYRY